MTTAFGAAVAKALGVCVTTNPAGTLRSGSVCTRTLKPSACSSAVAAFWPRPTTLGTVTLETRIDDDVDDVDEDAEPLFAPDDDEGSVAAAEEVRVESEPESPLRTSATTATTSASSEMSARRSR